MLVKFYGTRGSVPVSSPEQVKIGGNTSCVRVVSECLPPDSTLAIDAGSGIVPLGYDMLKQGCAGSLSVLFTHYHHDHTQGMLLLPQTFIKGVRLQLLGPEEHGWDPRKVMEAIMQPPLFPVDFTSVSSHFVCKGIKHPDATVILFHPEGGTKIMNLDQYEQLLNDSAMFPVGKGRFPLSECLVVRMHRSNHPERTISYRFEERSTGKVFCFLTDHENQDGIPNSLRMHLNKADLLVVDAQYDRETYDMRTAGFGHGTPDYCVRLANAVEAKRLGLTHHDPRSTDEKVSQLARCAQDVAEHSGQLSPDAIFVCCDYQEVEL